MKLSIRTRLSILFTLITATIVFVFAAILYYSSKENREQEFYSLLEKEAITKANLFFDAKVETQTLQDIYRNNREVLYEVEVAIYKTDYKLLYHDAIEIDFVKETKPMLDKIMEESDIKFYQEGWQVVGFLYTHQEESYIVTAAAYDQYGYNKLNLLLRNSTIVFFISIIFIYLAGLFFSKKAFRPVGEMVHKAKKITATNLDLRISSNTNHDELTELANTFNEMLNRLESSFNAQKSFVSNISHELRTPLTAMITELELASGKNISASDYKAAIENTLNDARKLVRLSNSLLDLAKASYDPSEISFKKVRIDEVLLEATKELKKSNPNFAIEINFENKFDINHDITINGNEYLLKVAFANLIENGCKFSGDAQVRILIGLKEKNILLKFYDNGIGISEEDLEHIFKPFFRGENKTFSEGNGIGLSLTQKIIKLHGGQVLVFSQLKKGTQFHIELPSSQECMARLNENKSF